MALDQLNVPSTTRARMEERRASTTALRTSHLSWSMGSKPFVLKEHSPPTESHARSSDPSMDREQETSIETTLQHTSQWMKSNELHMHRMNPRAALYQSMPLAAVRYACFRDTKCESNLSNADCFLTILLTNDSISFREGGPCDRKAEGSKQ